MEVHIIQRVKNVGLCNMAMHINHMRITDFQHE